MKKIVGYLRAYLQEYFHWGLYLYTAVFLGIAIYLNYTFKFEKTYINIVQQPHSSRFIAYVLFYSFAYFAIAIPQAYFIKADYLKKREFWIRSAVFLFAICLFRAFWQYRDWIIALKVNTYEQIFLFKVVGRAKSLITTLIILFVFWWWVDRKQIKHFYGLTTRGFSLQPYMIMLLIMLPFLIWASFQPAFLKMYPQFKPWVMKPVFGLTTWQMFGIYETVYSADFVMVELFFRGALVIGLASAMKNHSIVPMIVLYCFLHFEKPMAEAIGSVFGGYILGIIALRTRSILGGVCIHLGVALLMDTLAIVQYLNK
ncbi:MAG TPA: hypothetical protein DCS93_29090 [Microscillaceae bacterium]|nr:hypothetical protein [Microscillaceae bacterium]